MSWFSKRPAPNPPGGEITTVMNRVQTIRSSVMDRTLTVKDDGEIVTIHNGTTNMYNAVQLWRKDLPAIIAMLQAEVNS